MTFILLEFAAWIGFGFLVLQVFFWWLGKKGLCVGGLGNLSIGYLFRGDMAALPHHPGNRILGSRV